MGMGNAWKFSRCQIVIQICFKVHIWCTLHAWQWQQRGWGDPRTPSGAMSWGSYQTDAAIWHSRRHQTCQKVHYLILKVNKVLWSIEGKFHGGTALWNIWRSHKRGTFMTFGGHWWTFFVCLWKSRQILLNGRVGWRSGQAGLIRDYGWELQRTLRPGCLPLHTMPYPLPTLVCAHHCAHHCRVFTVQAQDWCLHHLTVARHLLPTGN